MASFSDGRRLHVALTRSKRGFIMTGNLHCLYNGDRDGSWSSFLRHLADNHAILRVHGEGYETYENALDPSRAPERVLRLLEQRKTERVRAAAGVRKLINLPDSEVAETVACAREGAKKKWPKHMGSLQCFCLTWPVSLRSCRHRIMKAIHYCLIGRGGRI